MANVKHIHVMKIMEFAAAIALVLKPEKAIEYFRKLGIPIDAEDGVNTSTESADDVSTSTHNPNVQAALKRELGL